MKDYFFQDDRLGIQLPVFNLDWDDYSPEVQQDILLYWEKIRGTIPDRIASLEKEINLKQAQLSDEDDFEVSCLLNSEISELAANINELWLWFRINQGITGENSQIIKTEKVHQ